MALHGERSCLEGFASLYATAVRVKPRFNRHAGIRALARQNTRYADNLGAPQCRDTD